MAESKESRQSGQFALPSRRAFHSFRASQRGMKAPRKIPGYASLPACSLGERPIDRNQSPQNLRRSVLRSGSYKFVFRRDCTLEAMRTQGAISFLSLDLVFLPVFPGFFLAIQPIVVVR